MVDTEHPLAKRVSNILGRPVVGPVEVEAFLPGNEVPVATADPAFENVQVQKVWPMYQLTPYTDALVVAGYDHATQPAVPQTQLRNQRSEPLCRRWTSQVGSYGFVHHLIEMQLHSLATRPV